MGILLRALRVGGFGLRIVGRHRAATLVGFIVAVGWLVLAVSERSDAAIPEPVHGGTDPDGPADRTGPVSLGAVAHYVWHLGADLSPYGPGTIGLAVFIAGWIALGLSVSVFVTLGLRAVWDSGDTLHGGTVARLSDVAVPRRGADGVVRWGVDGGGVEALNRGAAAHRLNRSEPWR
jgi:hypothetical protein